MTALPGKYYSYDAEAQIEEQSVAGVVGEKMENSS